MKAQSSWTVMFLVACSFATAIPAKASFLGHNVSVNYEWPDLGTVLYSGGSSIVAPGGTIFDLDSAGLLLAEVTGSNILVTFSSGWLFDTAAKTFDGIVVTDSLAVITGVSLASTNIAGFGASNLSFNANNVYIDFPFPPFSALDSGASISVNVQFASPTPEPATLYLTTAFLAILLVWHRHRLAA